MSKDQSSTNLSAADDVTYVFYRGVRTPVRKPILQASSKTPENTSSHNKQTETVTPVTAAPALPIKKVSPSQAKPWLDDSVVLSAKPDAPQLEKSAAESPKTTETLPTFSQRQRPQLPLLRPGIQLPPLFAACEVMDADDSAPFITTVKPLVPLRKSGISAEESVSAENAESVTNQRLLQEIAQLRAAMTEIQRTLSEMQIQISGNKDHSQ